MGVSCVSRGLSSTILPINLPFSTKQITLIKVKESEEESIFVF